MSLTNCLIEAVQQGRLTREQAGEVSDLYEDLLAQHQRRMSDADAAALATRETVEAVSAEAARRRRLTYMQAQKANQITQRLRDAPNMAAAANAHIVRGFGDHSPWANIDSLRRSIEGISHAKWLEGIKRLRPTMLGLQRHRVMQRKALRELFGESTGDADAATIARAWKETAEYLRERFNRAGGNIARLLDWGLPQIHSQQAVSRVTKQEWIDEILPRLDRSKMVDGTTGRPLDDMELTNLLDMTYERIRTDGLIDMKPGQTGGRMLANRHQDHRFLHFKSADDWLAYQERFGNGDVYSTMVNHLETMSKDIAVMEVLGPNPDGMHRYMRQFIEREAALRGEERPATSLRLFDNAYAVVTNRINTGGNPKWGHVWAGLRNVLTSAQLGGAWISSWTDMGFRTLTLRFNGIPATGVVRNQLRMMNPRNIEDQQLAVQLGLIADNWTGMALAQQRYIGEVQGSQITKMFADSVLRVSLLSPWTQAGRWAFGTEVLGFMARNVERPFSELPTGFQNALRRYGLNENDWATIQRSELLDQDGARFVNPVRMAEDEASFDTATKLQQLLIGETEHAVPNVDSRVRAITLQGTQQGTLVGEIMRSVAMYKSFPITVLSTHMMRGLSLNGVDKGKYLAELFITTTMLGALAYQAKQIARGKDPISMDPRSEEGRKLWMGALWQGGGLGIFSDFLFADVNRFGAGPVMSMAGPVAQFGDDVVRLTAGQAQRAVMGEDTTVGRDALRFAQRYMPGGSLWYSRLAMERLVMDQLQTKVDPDYWQSFRRQESFARNNYGQRYWWRPGQTRPDRAPDFGAAIGE